MPDPFTHLHTHSDHSILAGLATVDELVAAASGDGQESLALTDAGSTMGHVAFVSACERAGIRPILGVEGALRVTRDDPPVPDEVAARCYPLTILAEGERGLSSLYALCSKAGLSGGSGVSPAFSLDDLSDHRTGLVVLTGGPDSVISRCLAGGDYDTAERWTGELTSVVGVNQVAVEVGAHGAAVEAMVNPGLVELAGNFSLPLVATADVRYAYASQRRAHDLWLAIGSHETIGDPNRPAFPGDGYHLATSAEMAERFSDLPEALAGAAEIAERCRAKVGLGAVPEKVQCPLLGPEDDATLRRVVARGVSEHYGPTPGPEVEARVAHELAVIGQTGFAGYFLTMAETVAWARHAGIAVGPGRGSAVGSVVAYACRITDVDPLVHELSFERFLHEGRGGLPDIDIDVADNRRAEVLTHLADRYGADRVARLSTIATLRPKAAIRDAARALGAGEGVADKLAGLVDQVGEEAGIAGVALAVGGRGGGPRAEEKRVLSAAAAICGRIRSVGTHPSAVVVSARPLSLMATLTRANDGGVPVLSVDGDGAEALGLTKMDFLGSRAIRQMETTIALVRSSGEACPELGSIPLCDEKTLALLASGRTVGVFQMESQGMARLLASVHPTSFADIAAVGALYRPGPLSVRMHERYVARKNGGENVTYLHPDLEPILSPTHGVLVYQEQVTAIAERFGGFSPAEADGLRRACAKKHPAEMAAMRECFVAGCVREGYGKDLGAALFAQIEPFAAYGFNKSHAVAYGIQSWRSAYLCAHHPAAFLAASLSMVMGERDRLEVLVGAAHHEGIQVLPAGVNASGVTPTIESGAIRLGLACLPGVGESAARAIVAERVAGGPFTTSESVAERVAVVNKGTLAALSAGGALPAPALFTRSVDRVIPVEVAPTSVPASAPTAAPPFPAPAAAPPVLRYAVPPGEPSLRRSIGMTMC